MRILLIVQGLLAAALLLLAVVTLVAIGLTGLILLAAAAALAALAGVAATQSRLGVLAVLAADGVIAWLAGAQLLARLGQRSAALATTPSHLVPSTMDLVLPAAVVALIAAAFIGVLVDWRQLRDARWF